MRTIEQILQNAFNKSGVDKNSEKVRSLLRLLKTELSIYTEPSKKEPRHLLRSDATFSKCGKYRYALWRIWDETKPEVMFLMLNPSTADGTTDDPTIRRCIAFAKAWGYGGILVGNLYAYRATDPDELNKVKDPVGPANAFYLSQLSLKVETVVCAWGSKVTKGGFTLPSFVGVKIVTLGLNKDGTPKHPLYVKGDAQPIEFKPEKVK